ncbi:ferrous iron transport protein A [Clostridium botulinum]|uniref:Ferrous iron transport protein n=8 Tax=Clostridium TaxID=1485 RepID=A5I0M0_CLOBH|nr:ferrous iron transport protein A [Clostridium botulinum]NEZ53289.1 ferrous iron transport protein A [Clostridium botulinum F str. Langeland]NFK37215.1 ferrous iron transport protein A [Clostridium botulinum H04402 065]PIH06008.1 ferrous iron transport protein A [Clostridium combesii]CAL82581.1 putative ferrous iron transport protein [Clostridium botulinum A str. ATCC 3502]
MSVMTLSMAREGEINQIKKITGRDNIRQFLAKLGFVEGESVTVISEISGNMIINVKDSRIAIGKSMANRIII